MRWIKCLGIVGVGGLLIALLPDLQAHSQKAPQKRRTLRTPPHSTRQKAPQTPRTKVQLLKIGKPKRAHTHKLGRPMIPVVLRPIVRTQKLRKKGKKKKDIHVACRMILLISGMT